MRLARLPVIKAIAVAGRSTPHGLAGYDVAAFLFDSSSRRPEESGLTFDWGHLARLEVAVPVVLAGGLTPANVAAAITAVRPAAVDVSSGVESSPGDQGPRSHRGVHRRGARSGMTTDMAADDQGWFGPYGGRFVPETLVPALDELEAAWRAARVDPGFRAELARPALGFRREADAAFGGEAGWEATAAGRGSTSSGRISPTPGAHKINNTLGQVLLARRMGKTRVIAETGAGQHGVATATACALFGIDCEIFMGTVDVRRQALNVTRMELLGARVIEVTSGSQTLKDAMNEAIRDWIATSATTHYVIGSVAGPHPYPSMVAEFQSVIGTEARAQCLERIGQAALGGRRLRRRRLELHGRLRRFPRTTT